MSPNDFERQHQIRSDGCLQNLGKSIYLIMTNFAEVFVKHKKTIIISFVSTIIYYCIDAISYFILREVPLLRNSAFLLYYSPTVVAFLSVFIFISSVYGTSILLYKPNLNSLFAAVGFIVVSFIFLRSTSNYFYNPFSYDSVYFNKQQYVAGILLIGFLSPLLEEIIFRGYIFQATENNFGILVAWIVNFGLFTITHFFIGGMHFDSVLITLWYCGLVIITLSYQIGKLPASVAVHSFINVYIFLSNIQ